MQKKEEEAEAKGLKTCMPFTRNQREKLSALRFSVL